MILSLRDKTHEIIVVRSPFIDDLFHISIVISLYLPKPS